MRKKIKSPTPPNAGSLADIAFLLLIFFLLSTTIAQDKGLRMQLPPKDRALQAVHQDKVLRILLNARRELLLDGQRVQPAEVRPKVKAFVLEKGKDTRGNYQKAIISLKTDRGTPYAAYLQLLDEVKAAYNELRAEALGLSPEEYRQLNLQEASPAFRQRYEMVQAQFPAQISEEMPSLARP
ncbi:MAG: biopolymer transporter ExbD [Microscillaceae bacterium]